jgi:hypothetical protein
MKLKFGKFKGYDLRNVPRDYLEWMLTLESLWPPLRAEVESLLDHYKAMRKPRPERKNTGQDNSPVQERSDSP